MLSKLWKSQETMRHNCFYVGSFCQALFVLRLDTDYIPEPEVRGHPFAVGLLPQGHAQEEVSRELSA